MSLLGTGSVTATKVALFSYLRFKKDDDKLEEPQGTDNDKRIRKWLIFKDNNLFNTSDNDEITQPSGRTNI